MNEKDFSSIEADLELKLPEQYRQIMKVYPLEEVNSDFYPQAQLVLDSNRSLRQDGFFEQIWPKEFFAFGDDGCGNYWFLDLRSTSESVYQADHEDVFSPDEVEEMFFMSNLQEFADYCNQMEAEIKAEQSQKPWWKFWA